MAQDESSMEADLVSDNTDQNARHTEKMKKIKAARDRMMANKTEEKGLIMVHTGPGKGKSSSGFGMIMRCISHGMPCAVVQFIKGAMATGERAFLEQHFPDECKFYVSGEGFTWETQDRQRDIAAAEAAWAVTQEMLRDPTIGLVILDELNIALKHGYLDLERVLSDLQARPPMQHVVITGRGAKQELIDLSDTVSEIGVIKHAFQAGIKAQKGIEL